MVNRTAQLVPAGPVSFRFIGILSFCIMVKGKENHGVYVNYGGEGGLVKHFLFGSMFLLKVFGLSHHSPPSSFSFSM